MLVILQNKVSIYMRIPELKLSVTTLALTRNYINYVTLHINRSCTGDCTIEYISIVMHWHTIILCVTWSLTAVASRGRKAETLI